MAYATLDEVRALNGLENTTAYPDEWLTDGIDFATETIDVYCGTSFEYKAFTATVTSDGGTSFLLAGPHGLILFPRTIATATLDGEALSGYTWTFHDEGLVEASVSVPSGSLTLAGTAGYSTTPPVQIAWAARTIARQYVLDLVSRIPDRALQLQGDYGTIQLAQPGGRHGPTSLPEVNAVLARYRFRAPSIG